MCKQGKQRLFFLVSRRMEGVAVVDRVLLFRRTSLQDAANAGVKPLSAPRPGCGETSLSGWISLLKFLSSDARHESGVG